MSVSHASARENRTMSDLVRIREFLRNADWGPVSDDYIGKVVREVRHLRQDYPNRDWPAAIHGPEEGGACFSCDAVRFLEAEDDERKD